MQAIYTSTKPTGVVQSFSASCYFTNTVNILFIASYSSPKVTEQQNHKKRIHRGRWKNMYTSLFQKSYCTSL
jgi:hypothetical protein